MDRFGLLLARTFFAITGGVPLLGLACGLVLVWLEPVTALGGDWLRAAVSMVLIEFLLLHSGAFMAAGPTIFPLRWQRLAWFLGFSAVYAISLISYARWCENDSVLWLLIGVVISRLLTLVVLHDQRGTILMLQRSAVGMIVLIVTAVICFIPWPPLGITESMRYNAFGETGDLLSTYPQRMIAWGVAYFTLMGLIEVWAGWRMPDWTDEQVQEGWRILQRKTDS
jgi:hypothetical protein